jgi:hypothetical protein
MGPSSRAAYGVGKACAWGDCLQRQYGAIAMPMQGIGAEALLAQLKGFASG